MTNTEAGWLRPLCPLLWPVVYSLPSPAVPSSQLPSPTTQPLIHWGWAGLGWAGLGWAGLGWLGWSVTN